MGIHGEDRQEQGERRRVSWDLAEIMGYALVVILVIFLSVCVAAASTRGSQLGPDTGNGVLGFANRFDLGEVLEQASAWASPQFATLFIFGSLGMVWWQIETWSPDEGEMLASEASAHLARATFFATARPCDLGVVRRWRHRPGNRRFPSRNPGGIC